MLRRHFLLGLASAAWPLSPRGRLLRAMCAPDLPSAPVHAQIAVGNTVSRHAVAGGALLDLPNGLPWHRWSTLLFAPVKALCSHAGRRAVVIGTDEERPWTAYLHFVLATDAGIAPLIMLRQGAPDWGRVLGFLAPGVTGERRYWCWPKAGRGAEEMDRLGSGARAAHYHMEYPRRAAAPAPKVPVRNLVGARLRQSGGSWADLAGRELTRFLELVEGGRDVTRVSV